MTRARFSVAGSPGSMNGAGLGQSIGWWRPEKSTGKIAIPEGPQRPIERPTDDDITPDGRHCDPRTAANLAAKAEALAPRRWRPS